MLLFKFIILLILLWIILLSIKDYRVKRKIKAKATGWFGSGVFKYDTGLFIMVKYKYFVPVLLLFIIILSYLLIEYPPDTKRRVIYYVIMLIFMLITLFLIYQYSICTEEEIIDLVKYKVELEKEEVDLNIRKQQEEEKECKENKVVMLNPRKFDFSDVNNSLALKRTLLYLLFKRTANVNMINYINNILEVDDKLIDILENEFISNKHLFVTSKDEFISPSLDKIIEVNRWLDNDLIVLIMNIYELNSNLHKLYLTDKKGETSNYLRKKFLCKLFEQRQKVNYVYKKTRDLSLIIIYLRLCMLEIIYRKTISWIMSGGTIFKARMGNNNLAVVIEVCYDEQGVVELGKDGCYGQHDTHYIVNLHDILKLKDIEEGIGYDINHGILVNNRGIRTHFIDNVRITSLNFESISIYDPGYGHYYCYKIEEVTNRLYLHQNRDRRSTYLIQPSRFLDYKQESVTINEVNVIFNDNNHVGNMNNIEQYIMIENYYVNVFDVYDDYGIGGRYKYINDSIGYRYLEVFNKNKLLFVYAGTGSFKLGIKKIKKVKLIGNQDMQEMFDKINHEGIEYEWNECEDYNDHTYAHNLSKLKRAMVINQLQNVNILLEVGSNLNSQMYTNGLIVNLANVTHSDIERKDNLIDKVVNLLNWMINGKYVNDYLCLNFQRMEEMNLKDIEVDTVLCHNVIHNIPLSIMLRFYLDHASIRNIETSTYLPINVMSDKILIDNQSKMKWIYELKPGEENDHAKGLFYKSEGVVKAFMPAGDPEYEHDAAVLHDYFATTAVKVINGKKNVCTVSFVIKELLNGYIRLRIGKYLGDDEISSGLLMNGSNLPDNILHVKQNYARIMISCYNVPVSDVYKDSALVKMNNIDQRTEMMKSVRAVEQNEMSINKIRTVDTIKNNVEVKLYDKMLGLKDVGSEIYYVIPSFCNIKRNAKTVYYEFECKTIYDEIDDNFEFINRTASLQDLNENLGLNINLAEHNYKIIIKKLITTLIRKYNIIVLNNKEKFCLITNKLKNIVITTDGENYSFKEIRSNEVKFEECVKLEDINDVINVLLFGLESISDDHCTTNLLNRYGIHRPENESNLSVKQFIEVVRLRQDKCIKDKEWLSKETNVTYQTSKRAASQRGQDGLVTSTRTSTLHSHSQVEFDYLFNTATAHDQYCVIMNRYMMTNFIRIENGVRIKEVYDIASEPILVLIIKGHVYEIVNSDDRFLDPTYELNSLPIKYSCVKLNGKCNDDDLWSKDFNVTIYDKRSINDNNKIRFKCGVEAEDLVNDNNELRSNSIDKGLEIKNENVNHEDDNDIKGVTTIKLTDEVVIDEENDEAGYNKYKYNKYKRFKDKQNNYGNIKNKRGGRSSNKKNYYKGHKNNGKRKFSRNGFTMNNKIKDGDSLKVDHYNDN